MRYSDRLFNRGYVSLLCTQFLGAANDNILKQCLTFAVATGIWSGPIGAGGLGEGGQAVPALCLTLPFIFLSGYAGQIADRFSKRTVVLWVKLAEIPIAMAALVGFLTANLWITLAALLLLSIQSAFFGPAKYGVIPELVPEQRLCMANGLLNMLTNVAIIIGSLAAGPLTDMFDPKTGGGKVTVEPVRWAPGTVIVLVSMVGLMTALILPRLKATNPTLRFQRNPFVTYFKSLREMAGGPLLTVALAWSGFYMVGMMALMILPEYQALLEVSYTQTSYLLGILGIAIAIGSVAAGLISGHRIRPWLIPIGAIGMTCCFFLLGTLPPTYGSVAGLIFCTGVAAGFYIVPLQAMLQYLSPDGERGQFLGTANALSFCFSSLGAVVFWLATNRVGLPANRVHLICGSLALIGTVMGILQLRSLTRNDPAG